MKLRAHCVLLGKAPGRGVELQKYQTLPGQLVEMVDSDWAGDQETRKPFTCVCEFFGLHLSEVIVGKQTMISSSSGESEFYRIVQGSCYRFACSPSKSWRAIRVDDSERFFDCQLHEIRQWQGATLEQELWVQVLLRKLRKGGAKLDKVDTLLNWADIGTKALLSS